MEDYVLELEVPKTREEDGTTTLGIDVRQEGAEDDDEDGEEEVEKETRRGLFVNGISPGSLANQQGLLQVGDELLLVNDVDIEGKTMEELVEALHQEEYADAEMVPIMIRRRRKLDYMRHVSTVATPSLPVLKEEHNVDGDSVAEDKSTEGVFEVDIPKTNGKLQLNLRPDVSDGRLYFSGFSIRNSEAEKVGKLRLHDQILAINGVYVNANSNIGDILFEDKFPDVLLKIKRSDGFLPEYEGDGVENDDMEIGTYNMPSLSNLQPVNYESDEDNNSDKAEVYQSKQWTEEPSENMMMPSLSNLQLPNYDSDKTVISTALQPQSYINKDSTPAVKSSSNYISYGRTDKQNESFSGNSRDHGLGMVNVEDFSYVEVQVPLTEGKLKIDIRSDEEMLGPGLFVCGFEPKSKAGEQGEVRIGDELLEVNEKNVSGGRLEDLESVLEQIGVSELTSLKLKVRRKDDPDITVRSSRAQEVDTTKATPIKSGCLKLHDQHLLEGDEPVMSLTQFINKLSLPKLEAVDHLKIPEKRIEPFMGGNTRSFHTHDDEDEPTHEVGERVDLETSHSFEDTELSNQCSPLHAKNKSHILSVESPTNFNTEDSSYSDQVLDLKVPLTEGKLKMDIRRDDDMLGPGLFVCGFEPKSKAGEQGEVRIGDELLEVNGRNIIGRQLEDLESVLEQIGVSELSSVKLKVRRSHQMIRTTDKVHISRSQETSLDRYSCDLTEVDMIQNGEKEAGHSVSAYSEQRIDTVRSSSIQDLDFASNSVYSLEKKTSKISSSIVEIIMMSIPIVNGRLPLDVRKGEDILGPGLFVCGFEPKSKAGEQGEVRIGDELLEVNGKNVSGGRLEDLESVLEQIGVSELSSVKLKVRRSHQMMQTSQVSYSSLPWRPVSAQASNSHNADALLSYSPSKDTCNSDGIDGTVFEVNVPKTDGKLKIDIRNDEAMFGPGLFVYGFAPGCQAEEHGIRIGDELLAVNGSEVHGGSIDDLSAVMQIKDTSEGSVVRLRVRRPLGFSETPRAHHLSTSIDEEEEFAVPYGYTTNNGDVYNITRSAADSNIASAHSFGNGHFDDEEATYSNVPLVFEDFEVVVPKTDGSLRVVINEDADEKGLFIEGFGLHSKAALTGLLKVGDELMSVNGIEVAGKTISDVVEALKYNSTDDNVSVVVRRYFEEDDLRSSEENHYQTSRVSAANETSHPSKGDDAIINASTFSTRNQDGTESPHPDTKSDVSKPSKLSDRDLSLVELRVMLNNMENDVNNLAESNLLKGVTEGSSVQLSESKSIAMESSVFSVHPTALNMTQGYTQISFHGYASFFVESMLRQAISSALANLRMSELERTKETLEAMLKEFLAMRAEQSIAIKNESTHSEAHEEHTQHADSLQQYKPDGDSWFESCDSHGAPGCLSSASRIEKSSLTKCQSIELDALAHQSQLSLRQCAIYTTARILTENVVIVAMYKVMNAPRLTVFSARNDQHDGRKQGEKERADSTPKSAANSSHPPMGVAETPESDQNELYFDNNDINLPSEPLQDDSSGRNSEKSLQSKGKNKQRKDIKRAKEFSKLYKREKELKNFIKPEKDYLPPNDSTMEFIRQIRRELNLPGDKGPDPTAQSITSELERELVDEDIAYVDELAMDYNSFINEHKDPVERSRFDVPKLGSHHMNMDSQSRDGYPAMPPIVNTALRNAGVKSPVDNHDWLQNFTQKAATNAVARPSRQLRAEALNKKSPYYQSARLAVSRSQESHVRVGTPCSASNMRARRVGSRDGTPNLKSAVRLSSRSASHSVFEVLAPKTDNSLKIQFSQSSTSKVKKSLVIQAFSADSNARKQGILRVGDEILEVNSVDVRGKYIHDITAIIATDADSFILLKVRRKNRSAKNITNGDQKTSMLVKT